MLGFAVSTILFPGRPVAFYTDNTNVLAALNFSLASYTSFRLYIRRYLAVTASSVSYVASRNNPADFPSRRGLPGDSLPAYGGRCQEAPKSSLHSWLRARPPTLRYVTLLLPCLCS